MDAGMAGSLPFSTKVIVILAWSLLSLLPLLLLLSISVVSTMWECICTVYLMFYDYYKTVHFDDYCFFTISNFG
jgi:hypothetical protein